VTGLLAIIASVVLALLPRSAAGVPCGSALQDSSVGYIQTAGPLLPDGGPNPSKPCTDLRIAMGVAAVTSLAAGIALLTGGWIVTSRSRRGRAQAPLPA